MVEVVHYKMDEVYRIIRSVEMARLMNPHKYPRDQINRRATIYAVKNVVRVWRDGIVKHTDEGRPYDS